MEHELILRPLEGLELDGQLIPLGAPRAEVVKLLGEGEERRRSLYYFASELRLDFDPQDRVEFMECLGGSEGDLRPTLYGKSVFDTDAQELLELLSAHGEVREEEEGCSCVLPALGVGLYREITPAAMDAMLRQLLNTDLTAMSGIDITQELYRAHHWDTVGLGGSDYYND